MTLFTVNCSTIELPGNIKFIKEHAGIIDYSEHFDKNADKKTVGYSGV